MRIKDGQQTTRLGTTLKFRVYDLRGVRGFPQGQQGYVFEYREQRSIRCKYTGAEIKRDERYVLRTDDTGKGWRIDRLPKFGPAEAVYGQNREDYWESAEDAAKALAWLQDEIRDNTSLGTR